MPKAEPYERFFKEIEAICLAATEEIMVGEVFTVLCRRLGQAAARELFARLGPLPRSVAREHSNDRLMRLYIQAGRPNRRKGKQSMAEFARAMADRNKHCPKAERVGTGATSPDGMLRQLKRLINRDTSQMK
jgi:hypothetical protein